MSDSVKFCPSCSSILEIITLHVGGVPTEFWECPEGDWLDPVIVPPSAVAPEPEAES
jgi:hypothetical protein